MHPDRYQLQPYPVYVPPPPTSGLAVTSGIMGIVGILGGWCLCGIPCILAIVLGHLATRETRSGARGGHGWAMTGLVTGYLVVGPAILFSIFYVFLGGLGLATGAFSDFVPPTPAP